MKDTSWDLPIALTNHPSGKETRILEAIVMTISNTNVNTYYILDSKDLFDICVIFIYTLMLHNTSSNLLFAIIITYKVGKVHF